mmetsp:Transcript_51308/g.135139  ORF Transcript_51308/g.135139 Transcript_51308/m.135139 type:complete len:216 (-) Transcript_51308:1901-2548(-)
MGSSSLQGCRLQSCQSCIGPSHGAPRAVASTAMSRVRFCLPPPHVEEHEFQLVHWLKAQSLAPEGHMSVLHGRMYMLSASLQGFPPALATFTTLRVLVCWPPPHVALQEEYSDQSPQAQSTGCGQGAVLQGSSSRTSPWHCDPSPVECCVTVRYRILSPRPQLTGQSDQSVQVENSQFRAGSAPHCASQARAWTSGPLHASPPFRPYLAMTRCRS